MTEEHLYIVFSMEHYNPLGIVRSLGEAGHNPVAIILKNNRPITSRSRYIKKLHLVNSIEEGYTLLLERYGQEKHRPFVYTSDDKIESFLDDHYIEIKERFHFFNAGERGRVAKYMNKYTLCQMAQKHGLSLAETVSVKKGMIPDKLVYPIITKSIASTVGGWKKDVFICHSDEELKNAYKKIQSPEVLLQRYVKKKNELEFYGFSIDKGRKMFISIAADYLYLLPETYSHYMTIRNPPLPSLQQKIGAMIEEIGFEGIFSIEFLVDENDKLYFLEINFRNATWSYSSTCAGMNLPILWAEATLKQDIDLSWHKDIEDNFTAIVEPDDLRNRVRTHQISFVQWLKDLKKCSCLYYLNKKDMCPVIFWILARNKTKN